MNLALDRRLKTLRQSDNTLPIVETIQVEDDVDVSVQLDILREDYIKLQERVDSQGEDIADLKKLVRELQDQHFVRPVHPIQPLDSATDVTCPHMVIRRI